MFAAIGFIVMCTGYTCFKYRRCGRRAARHTVATHRSVLQRMALLASSIAGAVRCGPDAGFVPSVAGAVAALGVRRGCIG
jgi:hypothetical protein